MEKTGTDWMEMAADFWMLGAEASMVIPLRLARLARGDRVACAEAKRMVTEKIEAHGKLVAAIADGKLGTEPQDVLAGSVRHYLGYVRANRKRLMRSAGK